jgi:triosephosphate isomerase
MVVAVSLKMYLGYEETLDWCSRASAVAARYPTLTTTNALEIFVLPSFPVLAPVIRMMMGRPIGVGAQNGYWEDRGPFTGEVSCSMLAEMGCRYLEVGHAERRLLFRENDFDVNLKVRAALRHGLCPVICVGETNGSPAVAARTCLAEVDAALSGAPSGTGDGVIVAYEPRWAIGADEPAPATHIAHVCSQLKAALRSVRPDAPDRVIYGGSAGPGMLGEIAGVVDGLFLGRYVHDPEALDSVLREILGASGTLGSVENGT